MTSSVATLTRTLTTPTVTRNARLLFPFMRVMAHSLEVARLVLTPAVLVNVIVLVREVPQTGLGRQQVGLTVMMWFTQTLDNATVARTRHPLRQQRLAHIVLAIFVRRTIIVARRNS